MSAVDLKQSLADSVIALVALYDAGERKARDSVFQIDALKEENARLRTAAADRNALFAQAMRLIRENEHLHRALTAQAWAVAVALYDNGDGEQVKYPDLGVRTCIKDVARLPPPIAYALGVIE